jgi:hypothetical protein
MILKDCLGSSTFVFVTLFGVIMLFIVDVGQTQGSRVVVGRAAVEDISSRVALVGSIIDV